jgi:hypothetical protein
MKNLLCVFLFLFITGISNSQIAYHDALFLESRYKSDIKGILLSKDVKQLFMHYYLNSNEDKIDTALINLNPFFKGLFQPEGVMFGDGSFMPKTFSSLGGIDVTNYSKGVSLFLIARAKQELNIAFFERFKKFVENNAEFRILFPNTTNSLGNLLAYQYSQMLPVLQLAFNKDMENVPQNLVEVLLLDKYYSKIKDFPEFIVILRSISLLQQIDNLSPPQFIERLPEIADFPHISKLNNLHSSLALTKIFSNAIRTKEQSSLNGDSSQRSMDFAKIYQPEVRTTNTWQNYWISPRDFYDNILNSPITLNIFLGLIYQQISNDSIKFNNVLLKTYIQNNEREVWWYKMQFSKLLTQIDNINATAQSIKQLKDRGAKPTNEDIYTFLNTTINLFDFGLDVADHYIADSKMRSDPYIKIAKNANNLYINTVSQKYALAMNNAICVINDLGNEVHRNKPDKKELEKKNIFSTKIISGLITYGTFIANMADADTPEQVQSAIEAAALPAGSSSFKKNYTHNIALNAYLGANAGNWSKDKSPSLTWNGNFRLTAPIGIAWTPISGGKCGAFSVFASLLDVGAIVDYQLKSDSTGQEINQKVYLSNILSPGGYIIYGFPWNLPLSVGFGVQYGPGLIKMGDNLWNPSWKCNFFIGVDIPIFNLNKGKGKVIKN